MSEPAFSLCVYCGSRPGNLDSYADAARAVGAWIGYQGGQLVYGGGSSGLMGLVAQATAAAGGRVVGVIPQSLVDREFANHACDELHIVQTMHERKALMAERSGSGMLLMIHSRMRKIDSRKKHTAEMNTAPSATCWICSEAGAMG